MKKQTVIKNGFYKKYSDDQKSNTQTEMKLHDNVNSVNQKEKDNLLKVLFNVLGAVFRFIIYALLFGLSCVGLTAIINDNIRILLLKIVF
jgi:hypothetical protein